MCLNWAEVTIFRLGGACNIRQMCRTDSCLKVMFRGMVSRLDLLNGWVTTVLYLPMMKGKVACAEGTDSISDCLLRDWALGLQCL